MEIKRTSLIGPNSKRPEKKRLEPFDKARNVDVAWGIPKRVINPSIPFLSELGNLREYAIKVLGACFSSPDKMSQFLRDGPSYPLWSDTSKAFLKDPIRRMRDAQDERNPAHISSYLFTISALLQDVEAIDAAKYFIHKGKTQKVRMVAMMHAANLILHRAKRSDFIALYDAVFKCADIDNLDQRYIAIQALEYKWRMMHHHKFLGVGQSWSTQKVNEVINVIKKYSLDYIHPELVIMLDFTLEERDEEKISKAYASLLASVSSDAVDSNLWFYDKKIQKFMQCAFEASRLLSPEDADREAYKNFLREAICAASGLRLKDYTFGQDEYDKKYLELVEKIFQSLESIRKSDSVFLDILRKENVDTSSVIKDIVQFFKQLPQAAKQDEKDIVNYAITIIADLLAPKEPELALHLYRKAACLGDAKAAYALGDFQEEPTDLFPDYVLEDFIPDFGKPDFGHVA